jgi:hypothetical protein
LRVFEPIEYRTGNDWVEGNGFFINEPEVLNQAPFIWPYGDSKNRRIVGPGAID